MIYLLYLFFKHFSFNHPFSMNTSQIKCYIFLLAVVLNSSILKAEEEQDSLVILSDLNFDIPQEKESFVFDDDTKLLDLFYFTDFYNSSEAEIEAFRSKFNRIIGELNVAKVKIKKRDKQIKLIYKTVHANFLKKYQNMANFHELVSEGTYNCVTATALYAMILDGLDLPYVIKETPRHVYLIAFPEAEQILVESTDPTKGYVFHNADYKNLFVQNLRKGKIISEQEFKSQDVNKLFEKYYYADKNIGMIELVSIHYSNNANTYFEKGNVETFHEQIRKAYYLYPCSRNSFLLFTSSVLLLEKSDYKEKQGIDHLLFLSRFIDKGISSSDIVNEFIQITHEYLVNSSKHEAYDNIYAKFDSAVTHQELRRELSFIYNYEKGRAYLIKGRYLKSYPFVRMAFEIKDGHADAQTNLISNLSNLLSLEDSSTKNFAEMDTLALKYPILLENNNFIQVYGICHLKCIEELFKDKKPDEGNRIIDSFEKLNAKYPIVNFSDGFIGRAYSEAAVYYFKKGYNSKSRNYLNKGLELAPRSNELKSRIRMLN